MHFLDKVTKRTLLGQPQDLLKNGRVNKSSKKLNQERDKIIKYLSPFWSNLDELGITVEAEKIF